MSKLQSIDKKVWDALLPNAEQNVDNVLKLFETAQWKEEKKYKEIVDLKVGIVPETNFRCITGVITITGDIVKGFMYDVADDFISAEMSAERRAGKRCRYFYYPDADCEKYFKQAAQQTEVKPYSWLYYQVMESSVPLVSDREFVALRTTRVLNSEKGKRKFIVAAHSVEPTVDFKQEKVVRAIIKNYNVFEEIGENKYTVRQNFFCDPCGSIPAFLFNMTLEGQCEFLITGKAHLEKDNK